MQNTNRFLKRAAPEAALSWLFLALTVLLPAGHPLFSASLPHGVPESSNTGVIWGRVTDREGVGLAKASVKFRGVNVEAEISVATDEAGWFSVVGLPAGTYSAEAAGPGYAKVVRDSIAIEPLGRIRLDFSLETIRGKSPGSSLTIDDIFSASRTYIPAVQIERLPTGNSINSLIENQDSIATSNRIDVGGLWEAIPSLFGSRGAASWTQNVFLYNGLDITEPYSGGTPLIVPDIYALDSFYLANAAAPIQSSTPGATLDLTPRRGGPQFHGGFWGFYLDKSFGSTNITPALQAENMTEADTFNRLMDLNVHFSGPLGKSKWTYFTSWSQYAVDRDLAGYEPIDKSRLTSGTIHLVQNGDRRLFRVFWTGQIAAHPSYGAGRGIPFETTVDRSEARNLLQVVSESRPGGRSSDRYGISLSLAGWKERLQNGASPVSSVDLFRGIPSGAAAAETDESRTRLSAFFDGRTMLANVAGTHHLLEYGVQAQVAEAGTTETIPGNTRLYFDRGRPVEVLFFESPYDFREKAGFLDAYVQDTMTLAGGASLSLGLHAAAGYGQGGGSEIRQVNISPRFAFQVPLSRSRTSFLRITAARYYARFPLSWLTWGNASAPGALAYAWTDANGDGGFSEDERGILLRREGPRYGRIDAKLSLPSTDELTVSFNHEFGRGWMISLAGFLRGTQGLVETENTGVPPTSYAPRTYSDIGDDQIPGSIDDLVFTVYDQNPETLGQDFYLLTNPGRSRRSTYAGLDFVLFKRPTDKFLFFLAMTATHAVQFNGPGNTAMENDDGVIGPLYDNPNAAINAEGRPRFDRAYTIRLGLARDLPFDTRIGLVAKYYDGQPFTRMIIVEGLTQGPVLIQAHPRGVARYEFNMTVDLRLEKLFRFSFGTIRLMADVFNLFNQNLATEEGAWTGPDFPRRFATDIQSPRTFRLGLNIEF